ALEADAAAVRLDDLAGHGEAEPGARDAALAGLAAEELREDPRLVLVGDPDPIVPDADADDAARDLAGHLDAAAFGRVLGRVPDDARERSSQLVRDDAHELRLEPLALAQLLVLGLQVAFPLLERTGHQVEGVRQLVDLGRTLLRKASRQVARGDAARAGGD